MPALANFLSALFCLFLLALAHGVSADDDADFLAAREAYTKGQTERFVRATTKVGEAYPLQAYLQYWLLKSAVPGAQDMEAFIGRYPDSPLTERFRLDLARLHAQNNEWEAFNRWASQLSKPDTEIRCHALRAQVFAGQGNAAQEGAQLYRTGRDLPSSCGLLFDALFERGVLREEDRLIRLRLALESGNLRLARELSSQMPESQRLAADSLTRAEREPAKLIAEAPTGSTREIVFYALTQIAKSDPAQAASVWASHGEKYPGAEQQYGWAQIATQAARQLHPGAPEWFLKVGAALSENQAIWRARAMLRAGRWLDVFRSIEAMPESVQEEAVWRYWKGRSLKALGAVVPANTLFARLSGEIHYYGVLASEELPVRIESQTQDYRPSQEEMSATRRLPGIDRSIRLRRLGLMADATSEWLWALRGMNDAQLLAAAEIARQEGWYDRAINTADTTRDTHNFDLRYLTPYRDLAEAYAREQKLDPAWVFGLMRQESRFVDHAQSSAGAIGLMQIMPATARWIANQMGERKAHAGVREPATNIRFGTFYLKNIHDRLENSAVLATAGYNAGPGRARRWQANIPLEGAIYVESIPFTETREYVKKVLVNAVFYSQRLGTPSTRLKDRLGTIPARVDNATDSAPNI
ncbi:MAG: transglycosylase SLT domain-containing protein [Hydrogenophilales bacterium]|nr:transglycosylase SLT domain-containing protein [Hydrogenophilales bacterium]